MSPPLAGEFELVGALGKGGMGEVWAARHRAEGWPAAVKVITDARARDPGFQAAFRNEARAMAGFDHPGIVQIFDLGTLADGSPYIAMERLEPGDLPTRVYEGGWAALRGGLQDILNALAHAHARGVVHLDLKPDNVLFDPARGSFKLTDFGVAHAMDQDLADLGDTRDERKLAVGTPAYMAPEQIRGAWRDHGPWTDLYALGCVAWELATGGSPFSRPSPLASMVAQLNDPPPPFAPIVDVPEGYEAWMRRLLAKPPGLRYRRSADALRDLLALGESVPLETSRDLRPTGIAEVFTPTLVDETPPPVTDSVSELRTLSFAPVDLDPQAPVPETWWTAADGQRAGHARPGLFGLRATPLVGREALRDSLWETLREVRADGRPRAVLLTGSSGIGKSRLAEWFGRRAHELGAATVLRAVHTPVGGPAHGLGPMLERHLVCAGLDRREVEERLAEALAGLGMEHEAPALADLVRPARSSDGPATVRLGSSGAQDLLLSRFVVALARRRTVLLWFDDVQWGGRALDFLTHLLEEPPETVGPVLVVGTVREEALVGRPMEAARVERLLEHPRVARHGLGPLSHDETRSLLHAMLDLTQELAAAIAQRAAGQPLFAVQILGDWVHRRLLVGSPEGFRLAAGAEGELSRMPEDLREVWATRVERLLRNRMAEDGHALEVAALLGGVVDEGEWRAACRAVAAEDPDALVDLLLLEGLAECDPEGPSRGWRFAHALLREWLEARAEQAGRARDHHRACAALLSDARGIDAARLAHHYLAADEPGAAIEPLEVAARAWVEAGEPEEAETALASLREALAAIGAQETDARWGEALVLESRVAEYRAELGRAVEVARAAEELAVRHGWGAVRGAIAFQLGVLASKQGEPAAARAALESAVAVASQEGDGVLLADALRQLGMTLLHHGQPETARTRLEEALSMAESLDDRVGAGRCEFGLAQLAKGLGDFPSAAAHNLRAQQHLEAAGARNVLGACHNQLGELARLQGDLGAATRHYADALRTWDAMASGNAVFAQVNLALVLVERGRYQRARAALTAVLRRFEAQHRWSLAGSVHAYLLPCEAAARSWDTFDRHLEAAERLLARTGFRDPDAARMAERAAGLCDGDRAARARAFAGNAG